MGHGKIWGAGEPDGGRCEGVGGARKTHAHAKPTYIGTPHNVVYTRQGIRRVMRTPVPASSRGQNNYPVKLADTNDLSYRPEGQNITACFDGKGRKI